MIKLAISIAFIGLFAGVTTDDVMIVVLSAVVAVAAVIADICQEEL